VTSRRLPAEALFVNRLKTLPVKLAP